MILTSPFFDRHEQKEHRHAQPEQEDFSYLEEHLLKLPDGGYRIHMELFLHLSDEVEILQEGDGMAFYGLEKPVATQGV